MGKIRIQRSSGLAYINEDLRRRGFVEDVETLENALTVTLIKPLSSVEDVAHSLSIVLEDYYLRMGRRVEVRIEEVR